MKKLLLSFTLVLLCFLAFGQPTFLGTDLEGINNNGNFYRTYPLNDLGAFRQVQLTAFAGTNSTISGLPNPRIWEFTSGTSSPDYSVNWRPYDPNQTISGSGYNAIIAPDPVSRTASALYNTGFGGSSGLLTQVVTGSYYTINITEFAPPANQFMSILETNWCHNCRPINSVSGTGCLDECGYEVTVTMAFAPAANEFVYVRYSTDGFATSSLVEVNFPAASATGTATIPGQGAGVGVDYYVYSSNRTLSQIQNQVGIHGQKAHDLLTINLNNNGGSNYTVSACANFEKNLVITEFMADPIGTSTNGEWIELYNAGTAPVDLQGLEIRDDGVDNHVIASSVVVQPGAYVLLGSNADANANGGITLDYEYSGIFLSSNTDEIVIACGDHELDRVDYILGGPGNFPLSQSGKSYSLNPVLLNETANDDGSNWFQGVCPYGNGNNDGTPGATNETSDGTPPSAICQSTVVTLDGSGNGVLLAAAVDGGSTDACSGITSRVVSPNSFTCTDVGSQTVTLTVTDGSSNTAECTAIVNVQDNSIPAAVCQDVTVELDQNGNGLLAGSTVGVGSTDNCNLTYSLSQTSFGCGDIVSGGPAATHTENSSSGYSIIVELTPTLVNAPATCTNGYGYTVDIAYTVSYTGTPPNNPINTLQGNLNCSPANSFFKIRNDNEFVNDGNPTSGTTQTSNAWNNAQDCATVTPASLGCNSLSLSIGATGIPFKTINNIPISYNTPSTVTLTVTDGFGNSSDCVANVVVEDGGAPSAQCQPHTVSLDANGNYSLLASDEAAIGNGSSDACGSVSLAVSPNSFTCADVGSQTVTLTVTDEAGNSGTCNTTLSIEDPLGSCCAAPFASCQPVTVSLDQQGNGTLTAAEVDAGSSADCGILNLSIDQTSFGCGDIVSGGPAATHTENSSSGYSIIVELTPTLVNAPATCTNGYVYTVDIAYTVSYTGTPPNNPINTLQGNLNCSPANSFFNIRNDNEFVNDGNPTSGTTQTSNAWNNAQDCATVTPASLGCNSLSLSIGATGIPFKTINNIPISYNTPSTVTLTVTDGFGNSSDCVANVVVEDGGAPSAQCQPHTVSLDATGNYSLLASDEAAIGNGSSDACGSVSLSVSPNSFTCTDLGSRSVTLTVTDASGNTDQCNATVTVEDNIPPTVRCKDFTTSLDANGQFTFTFPTRNLMDDGSFDNCGLSSSYNVSGPTTVDGCNISGTYSFNYYRRDVNGNTGFCLVNITFVDDLAPTARCQDLTVQLDANGNASLAASDVNDSSSDNCSIASLSVSPNTFDCSHIGNQTVTLTTTDDSGNSDQCTADVTVADNTPPTAICASGIGPGVADIVHISAGASFYPIGDYPSSNYRVSQSFQAGQTGSLTKISINVISTINPGNVTLDVYAGDNPNSLGPILGSSTINVGSVSNADVEFALASPVAITAGNKYLFILSTPSPNSYEIKRNAFNPYANGAMGSSINMAAFTFPQSGNMDLDFSTFVAGPGPIIVSLDASGQASITGSDIDGGSSDNCSLSLTVSPNTFGCTDVGNSTVTLTVTDPSGNTDQCTATVTIEDVTPPTAICKGDVLAISQTVSNSDLLLTGAPQAPIQMSQTFRAPSNSPLSRIELELATTISVGDITLTLYNGDDFANLGVPLGSVTRSAVNGSNMMIPFSFASPIPLTAGNNYLWILTTTGSYQMGTGTIPTGVAPPGPYADGTLYTKTGTNPWFDITGVNDMVFGIYVIGTSPAPPSYLLDLDASGTASIAASDLDGGSSDACGAVSLAVSPASFTCADLGANTVTLTVTDENNNTSACTAHFTVSDPLNACCDAPVALCQFATVELDANGNATLAVSDVDAGSSADCGLAGIAVSPSSFTCNEVGSQTVTLTVTDGNSNSAACTANVDVQDNIAPTALCNNLTVQLGGSGTVSITETDIDGGSDDNCGGVSLSIDNGTFDCSNVGPNTVTLTVTDGKGNTASCPARVTVSDQLAPCCDAPVALCQPATVELDANGNFSLAASDVDAGSSADCGLASLVASPNSFDCGDLGSRTVTLTVTDINGSTDQCLTTVTVQDNTPPSFFTRACSSSNATGVQYADGWQSGDNDGSGFGAWTLAASTSNPANAGFFRGDSRNNGSPGGVTNDPKGDGDINTGGFALGMYANSVNSVNPVNSTTASRTFSTPLTTGSKFSIEFDNGNIDGGKEVSIDLRYSDFSNALRVRFLGGQSNYELQDANGFTSFTSIGFTDQGLLLEIEMLGNGQAAVTLTRKTDNVSQTLTADFLASGLGGNIINQFAARNEDAGSGPDKDFFINSMAVCYPQPNCPTAFNLNTDPGQCGAVVEYGEIGASDNCTSPVSVSQTNGLASGSQFPVGTTTNTFTVSDANGNSASCSFDVIVTDNEVPTITCQDVTLGLDPTGQVSLAVSNTPLANSVTDFNGIQGANGWEYGTYSAFNAAGFTQLPNWTGFVWNNSNTNLNFPQIDQNGGHPQIENLFWAVRRWTSNYAGAIRISGDFFDRIVGIPIPGDDGAHVRIFKNGSQVYEYLDIPGSSTPYSLELTVQIGDQIDFAIDPKFTAGGDDIHFTAVIEGLGVTTSVDDNCGVASRSVSPSSFACSDIGTHTVTVSVSDVNGNTASCSSQVTVVDEVAPVAKCQDVTVQLDANGQYNLVASEADNGSSDNCGLSSVVINGASNIFLSCLNANAPATTSLRATDNYGNFSECDVTITTLDVTPPTAICQPATVVLSPTDGTGSITPADVDGGSSDACSVTGLSVSPNTFDCSMAGANTVTLSVTDKFGNTASCSATVTVDNSQSSPATLAQQSCGNCGFIRIFYCQFDPNPASLNDFIDGTVAQNANYTAGNVLLWYDDNSGSQGGLHQGTGQEPATPNMNQAPQTLFYWVAQIDQNTGCIGDAIRVRVRVRKTPTPVFNQPTQPFCEGASLDLASLIDDPNNVADLFEIYDQDPAGGGLTPLASLTATNGSVDFGQNYVITPAAGIQNFWLVATNQGNANSITCPATTSMSFVVSATPVLNPVGPVTACPGEPVSISFSGTPAGGQFLWFNSNSAIGLGAVGLGDISFTAAANSSGADISSVITVSAISSSGCSSTPQSFSFTLRSDAVLDNSGLTACSSQPTGFALGTAAGSVAASSYDLIGVSLDPGLSALSGNASPTAGLPANALAADRFQNLSSGALSVTYSIQLRSTDNCLSDVQTVSLSIDPEPVLTAGLSATVCSGQAANLPLSLSNGLSGASFSWTPRALPTGISLLSSSSPGTTLADVLINNGSSPVDVIFDVTATAGGCTSLAVPCTLTVVPFPATPPTATLSACEDPSNPGQASFDLSSLDASIGGGQTVSYFADPNLTQPISSPAAYLSGNATVYAAVSSSGTCPNRTDVSLTVISIAAPQVSGQLVACGNEPQEVVPSPVSGISFNFYDGDPDNGGQLLSSGASYDPQLAPGSSLSLWITATDGSCEGPAVNISVTVNPAPTADASALLSNGAICENDTLELFGAGGSSYSWSGPNGFTSSLQNPVILPVAPEDSGDYILTVMNAFGCTDKDTVNVKVDTLPDAGLNGTLTLAANALPEDLFDYLGGTPISGGVWAGPRAPYGGDRGTFNPAWMPSGLYTYTLTNPEGCKDSVTIATVTVNVIPVNAPKLQAKIFLQGPLDTTTLLMGDDLRQSNFLQTFEPYTDAGYVHLNGGGNENFKLGLLDSTGSDALVDWVYIELRDPNDSTVVLATRSALLQRDGEVVELDGQSPVCFNRVAVGYYYVVIGHRNHCAVMTAMPIFIDNSGTVSLDFTQAMPPVFGVEPQVLTATSQVSGGVYVMIGGDADGNGQVQNTDDVNYWQPYVGASGYLRADYDLSGQVQNSDKVAFWMKNAGTGTQVPQRSN